MHLVSIFTPFKKLSYMFHCSEKFAKATSTNSRVPILYVYAVVTLYFDTVASSPIKIYGQILQYCTSHHFQVKDVFLGWKKWERREISFSPLLSGEHQEIKRVWQDLSKSSHDQLYLTVCQVWFWWSTLWKIKVQMQIIILSNYKIIALQMWCGDKKGNSLLEYFIRLFMSFVKPCQLRQVRCAVVYVCVSACVSVRQLTS